MTKSTRTIAIIAAGIAGLVLGAFVFDLFLAGFVDQLQLKMLLERETLPALFGGPGPKPTLGELLTTRYVLKMLLTALVVAGGAAWGCWRLTRGKGCSHRWEVNRYDAGHGNIAYEDECVKCGKMKAEP